MLQTIILYLLFLIILNGCDDKIDICNERTDLFKRKDEIANEIDESDVRYVTKRNNILKNMKERQNIADRVKDIVAENLGVDVDKVLDESSFIDDLGADELDKTDLVMAFEEEFEVEIPDEATESIKTVIDAVSWVVWAKDFPKNK